MDSCNSGSMQSSSCGDEEYDSRAESNISAFLNTNTPAPPPPPLTTQQHHHHNNLMFSEYPSSNYSPSQSQPHPNQNPLLLTLDMLWSNSKPPRSEPNQPDLGAFMMGPNCNSSSSSSPQNHQAFLLNHQFAGQTSTRGVVGVAGTAVPTTHLPPESGVSRGGLLPANDHQSLNSSNNTNTNMVPNPKKRSRASRRAPTTVLTTDTTNFRAMVQEFTGIPAPPFTSSFPRTRLDLFGSSSASTSSAIRSFDPHPTPSYLLRPFAQKLQPFSASSSMVNNLASNNISTPNNTENSTSNINYQLSQQQQQHNPILSFQSMIPPKYPPLIGLSASSSKAQQPSLEIPSTVKMGSVLEELGLSHAQHVNNNMVSAAASLERINNNMGNPSVEWAQRITGTVVADNNNDGSLSGIVAERVSNGSNKVVNYSNNKGPECAVAARTEGTVESWINCSSD